jgi:hypothetical protein
MEAVEGMAGDPAGIAAMAEDPGIGTIGRALAEGLADGGGDHDAEAAAVELGPAGHPGDMARDVEPAAEGFHDAAAIQIAEGGEGGIVADGGVGVLDGEIALDAVDQREGQQEGGDQVEAAAHVVDFVDLGQGGDGFDREAGGIDLQGLEQGDVVIGQARDFLDVELEGRDG